MIAARQNYQSQIAARVHAKLFLVLNQKQAFNVTQVTRQNASASLTLCRLPNPGEMLDAERDSRSAFEWQQSVLAYLEFRMGDSWRRLHRSGQRYNDVRQHWLEVFRTCSAAFNAPDHKPQSVLPRVGVEAAKPSRLAAALRVAKERVS